jgi:hypothetical protein
MVAHFVIYDEVGGTVGGTRRLQLASGSYDEAMEKSCSRPLL